MTHLLSPDTDRDTAARHLAGLGVADGLLDDRQRRALDRDGFLLLPAIIDVGWRERLRAAYDRLIAAEAREGQDIHLYDLVNKDAEFDRTWSHPLVLACVHQILARPFKLSSLNCREPRPGQGLQDLHADWAPRRCDDPFQVVNSLWLLDDFTADNGATRVVPGSHRWDGDAFARVVDKHAAHPQEIVLQAPAGSVLVFNAHAWHGGTLNRSGARRRVLHAYYTARENAQQMDQRAAVRHATWKRLSPAQRWLLDVEDDGTAD